MDVSLDVSVRVCVHVCMHVRACVRVYGGGGTSMGQTNTHVDVHVRVDACVHMQKPC